MLVTLGVAVGASVLWVNVRPNPALHKQFVSREEFDKLESRVDAMREDLLLKLEENNRLGEGRALKLHERINGIPAQIIALLGGTKGLL